jgi:hypothetical protein
MLEMNCEIRNDNGAIPYPSIVLFGSLYFLVRGRHLRHWRERANVVAGASGIVWATLTFDLRYYPAVASSFSSVRWVFGLAAAVILITLLLGGSDRRY